MNAIVDVQHLAACTFSDPPDGPSGFICAPGCPVAGAAEAKRRKRERLRMGDFQTPADYPGPICRMLRDKAGIHPAMIIEPSAGMGRFVQAAAETWPGVPIAAIELQEKYAPELRASPARWVRVGDFVLIAHEIAAQRATNPTSGWLALGNPPYPHAEPHVRAVLSFLKDGEHLAYLLRAAFLGSQERLEGLWQEVGMRARYIVPVAERPSFTEDGSTDATEYAVFIWEAGWTGETVVKWEWTVWKDR